MLARDESDALPEVLLVVLGAVLLEALPDVLLPVVADVELDPDDVLGLIVVVAE